MRIGPLILLLVVCGSAAAQPADTTEQRPSIPERLGLPGKTSKEHRISGDVEVGAIRGQVPFSTADNSTLNGYIKGTLQAKVFGIPLQMGFDLGTLTTTRGIPNRLRLGLDRQRLLEGLEDKGGAELDRVRNDRLSLEEERSMLFRKWKSAHDRLTLPELAPPDVPALPDTLGLPAMPDTALAAPSVPNAPRPDLQRIDSLSRVVNARAARLKEMDERLDQLKREEERLTALMNARQQSGPLQRALTNVRSFGIGTCTPTHSVFLINGLTLQGVSAEYASEDLYLAFDHGRSYDDAWRTVDPTRDRLQKLRETFFFQDPTDENPRKLTALKAGFGRPESTHVHIGMMRGTRKGLAFGAPSDATIPQEQVNHVVELDAGWKVARDHMARVTIGRSVLQERDPENTGDGDGLSGLMERRRQQNQAVQVEWSSRFPSAGTDLRLTGRAIDPYFQSLGIGFLRSGSRSAELNATQSLGKRLRLLGDYRIEERRSPGKETVGMRLHRWRARAAYRAFSWLTLRGGYAPIIAHIGTPPDDQRQSSLVVQFGGDARKKLRGLMLAFAADAQRFTSTITDGSARTEAWYLSGGCTATGEHLTVGLSLSVFADGVDSIAGTQTLDLRCSYRSERGLEIGAGAVAAVDAIDLIGWDISARRPIGRNMYFTLGAGHVGRPMNFNIEDVGTITDDNYTCRVGVGMKW